MTLESVNIMHACGMRGPRWRKDASLSDFPARQVRRTRQTKSRRNENPARAKHQRWESLGTSKVRLRRALASYCSSS
jgi:hypothetical protein